MFQHGPSITTELIITCSTPCTIIDRRRHNCKSSP